MSWELFDAQAAAYRESVLPAGVKARVSIEAGVVQGWHKYVGDAGIALGIGHFGASAPYKVIYEKFGLTADAMVAAAKTLL